MALNLAMCVSLGLFLAAFLMFICRGNEPWQVDLYKWSGTVYRFAIGIGVGSVLQWLIEHYK